MRPTTRLRHPESGMSMVVTLLIIMFLIALALGLCWYAGLHLRASGNLKARQQAGNAARAGLEHARAVLGLALTTTTATHCASNTTRPWSCDLAHTGRPTLPTGCQHDLPTDVNPPDLRKKGAILFDDTVVPGCPLTFLSSCALCNYTPTGLDPAAFGNYTVYVKNDPSDFNTSSYVADVNQAVVVRSEGRAQGATVVLEATITPGVTTTSTSTGTTGKNVDTDNSNRVKLGLSFQ